MTNPSTETPALGEVRRLIAAIGRGDDELADQLIDAVGARSDADEVIRGLVRFADELRRRVGDGRATAMIKAQLAALPRNDPIGDGFDPNGVAALMELARPVLLEPFDEGRYAAVVRRQRHDAQLSRDVRVWNLLRLLHVAGRVVRQLREDMAEGAAYAALASAPGAPPVPTTVTGLGATPVVDLGGAGDGGRSDAGLGSLGDGTLTLPPEAPPSVAGARFTSASPTQTMARLTRTLVGFGATITDKSVDGVTGQLSSRWTTFTITITPAPGGSVVSGSGRGRADGAVIRAIAQLPS